MTKPSDDGWFTLADHNYCLQWPDANTELQSGTGMIQPLLDNNLLSDNHYQLLDAESAYHERLSAMHLDSGMLVREPWETNQHQQFDAELAHNGERSSELYASANVEV